MSTTIGGRALNMVEKLHRKLTGVSFIAVQVEFITTSCGHDLFIILNGIDPSSPPTAHIRLGPTTIRSEHPAEAEYPRCNLDIDKRDTWAEEERSVDMRRVDQFGDLLLKFLRIGHLFLRILFLQDAVEAWNDMAIDLILSVSCHLI
jgi:hypothetical protein